ncbi:MAG: TetR/AcrR family transcriptional regulator [Saprospiraceae bacterium]|nr:TetR/AcrR family transcriptional regulator [Saprospiraceae bacterium]
MEKSAKDILATAESLFMKYGIRSVSMDDIAREHGISKKTIYIHFDSKKDLVENVAINHNEAEKEMIDGLRAKAKDAVHEMIVISNYVNQVFRELNPAVVYDLQKYFKSCWELFESLHTDFIYNVIRENIEKGQDQGLYRTSLNADVIARLYTGITFVMTDGELFPHKEFPKDEVYTQYINYHLNAILTEKGHGIYKKHQSNES